MNKLILGLGMAIVAGFSACSPKLSPDRNWDNRRWVVIELKGVPVQQSGNSRDAHIIFHPENSTFAGNGGCNRISGNYSLDKDEIDFMNVTHTMMSCADIGFEQAFLSNLDRVNRYEEAAGNRLHLKRGNDVIIILEER